MKTAAQYQHSLADLKLDQLLSGESKAEESALSAAQQSLLTLEGDLNLEMQVLRQQYQARLARAMGGKTGRVMVSNKRRVGGSIRAEEEDRIAAERDAKLTPYQQVKEEIVSLLEKVESARKG